MTESEALMLAKDVAGREGWPWEEPVIVRRYRTWPFFGQLRWHIMTNANDRGGNVNIHIDDRTATVTLKGFARR
jgi:hypothetical protein